SLHEYFARNIPPIETYLGKHISNDKPDIDVARRALAAGERELGTRVENCINAAMCLKYGEVNPSLYEQKRELKLDWDGNDWYGPQKCSIIEEKLAGCSCKEESQYHHNWKVPTNVLVQLVARAAIDDAFVEVGKAGAWDGHSGDDYSGTLKVNAAVPSIGRRGRQAAAEAQDYYIRVITRALKDPALKHARGKLLSHATNPRIDIAWIPPAATLSLETQLPPPIRITCAVLLRAGKQYLVDAVKARIPAKPRTTSIEWELWQSYCDKDQ
ncbi:hypothetical protein HY642_03105, partial [Candidatus Woesearchaeota archaeon]|nr:hypothetical protein [Candidatus Woesearchaeota archaeon]